MFLLKRFITSFCFFYSIFFFIFITEPNKVLTKKAKNGSYVKFDRVNFFSKRRIKILFWYTNYLSKRTSLSYPIVVWHVNEHASDLSTVVYSILMQCSWDLLKLTREVYVSWNNILNDNFRHRLFVGSWSGVQPDKLKKYPNTINAIDSSIPSLRVFSQYFSSPWNVKNFGILTSSFFKYLEFYFSRK